MTIRVLCLATVLASGAAAGSPAECAARTGSQQQGISLSAAIGEARRSPFHAVSGSSARGEAPLSEVGIDATTVSHAFQSAPQAKNLTQPVVTFTFIASVVSHLAGSYLLFYCLDDDSYRSSIAGCIVGPIIPWPAVAAPSAGTELGAGKAFKASAFGLLGGAAMFSVTMLASDSINNIGAALISGVVHFLVATAVLRRP